MTLSRYQFKTLRTIYHATDCFNEVYDYATLHPKQRVVAEQQLRGLVTWIDGCTPVDGNGFAKQTYSEGRGYRLTNAGYEALTLHSPEMFPPSNRRFYASPAH